MRTILSFLFLICFISGYSQSDDRVKLRDLQAAPASNYLIHSVNDTAAWFLNDSFADSLAVVEDSIIVLFAGGSEISRDTVGPFGGGGGSQTLTLDGTSLSISGGNTVEFDTLFSTIDHGSLLGLSDDDHTQYALLAGRSGGQTLNGGTGSGENLNLTTTSNVTKGNIVFSAVGMGWTRASTNDNMIMQGNTIKATAGRFNYGWGEDVFSASMGSTNDGNIAIGKGNLKSINDLAADYNVAIGTTVMGLLTSGSNNTAVGNEALLSITTGGGNTAMGAGAGRSITSGGNNFAFGGNALRGANSTGSVAIGSEALRLITSGDYNAAIGNQAARNLVSGSDFVVGIGYQAAYQANGDRTVAIGTQAGYNAGATGVYLGNLAGFNETNSDRLYIENSNTTSPLIGGNFSSNYVGINTAVASLAAALHITGTGATSSTDALFVENSSGTDLLLLQNDGALGILENLPARTLDVGGEVRIQDLTTDAPTGIVGHDGDGDLGTIAPGPGLSLSSSVLDVTPITIQSYASATSTTFAIPTGAQMLEITCIGGGGGGGGGRVGATSEANTGGGGGSGGAYTFSTIPVSQLSSSTLTIEVGAGGSGGSGAFSSSTDGSSGSIGGETYVSCSSFVICYAEGGNPGDGGSTSATTGGEKNTKGDELGGAGSGCATTGVASNSDAGFKSAAGGAAGGGIPNGGTPYNNGGSAGKFSYAQISGAAGGASDGASGANAATMNAQSVIGGGGGAGGASTLSSFAGNGGNGRRGGGGGGGGAALNGNFAGSGGDGGDGYILIVVKY